MTARSSPGSSCRLRANNSTQRWAARRAAKDEEFFLLGVDEEEADILRRSSHRDLTPEEEKVLEESKWWSLADLAEAQAAGASLYPRALVDMAQKWVQEGSRQVFHIVES